MPVLISRIFNVSLDGKVEKNLSSPWDVAIVDYFFIPAIIEFGGRTTKLRICQRRSEISKFIIARLRIPKGEKEKKIFNQVVW